MFQSASLTSAQLTPSLCLQSRKSLEYFHALNSSLLVNRMEPHLVVLIFRLFIDSFSHENLQNDLCLISLMDGFPTNIIANFKRLMVRLM
ncbi:unnamed protein product [Microthlaspi erraticum]|uniref:Uncharacterized protein n=1 Tax=Microthlaspi erraticum TaxID=1685480 RepID=A0A6D2J8X4_9BRAS|nr:unnamed protein product [Microthlaspi erraticum]